LGAKADPFASAPAGIRPEWYFVYMFETLKLLPAKIGPIDGELVGILSFGLAGALLLLVPFIETRLRRYGSVIVTGVAVFALVYMVVFTVYGYLPR
jgi:quinol-cytochrome oxidoreductase complex cytochrome b subunit